MAVQDYQVNYDINVKATGIEQLRQFGESVEKITKAKLNLDPAVKNIQGMMNSIDKIFRDPKTGKAKSYNYSVKIETKGTEDRLNRVVGLLDQIKTKSKDIKLTIAAGKPLTTAQVKANAKNIAEQNAAIAKQMGGASAIPQAEITKTIGKINSALHHLERGREINIKTDAAKARLNEILGLLNRIGTATGKAMNLDGVGARGPVNATKTPFAPAYSAPYVLPQKVQEKLNGKLATNQALHQQRMGFSNETAAQKIQQQARADAARIERQNQQRAIRQQEADNKRAIAAQQKATRDAQRARQAQATDIVRGYARSGAIQESVYGSTRRAAINRLQYSRPPSLRSIPFGYMLNGYMMFSTMKRKVTEAVEYANTMESARSILRVADNDLGTFEGRFNNMARNVRQVGVETKFTAVQVAGAVKYLAMAGQGIDTINKSIRPITNLALIGDNDLETIADLTTNIMAGYDINPDSMNSVADIIASTISRSNVNIIETAESFKMAAGTLRMAGIDFSEASAAIGILGNAGIKGTMAGTSLRAISTRLASPTKGARETLDRLGVGFKEKYNVYGKEVERFRPIADIFEDLAKAGATLEDMHKIFGVRGANAGMMFLQSYDQLRTLSANNRTSTGISGELAKIKQETTKGLWYQMTSQFTETFMQGYELMEPQIQMVLRNFLSKFNTEEFARGLASLGSALLDLIRVLGNIAAWFAKNFNWLGPILFTGFAATKLFKFAGAVTNLGVALGFLGKKSAALSGVQLIQSLTGMGGLGGLRLKGLSFGDKRNLVTSLRGMGVTGSNTMVQALRGVGARGGAGLMGRTAAGAFSTQVVTGRGIVGAGASLGALGSGAVLAAGGFAILGAAIAAVAYKTWKMIEVHRAVMEELEKKEKYSFPSIDALYTSLNKAYKEAKATKAAVDELTMDKKVIDETGQPMGIFSPRGWAAIANGLARSEGAYGIEAYTQADAYQENITEALTTLARQQSVNIRSSFYGELGKQRNPMEAAAFLQTIPQFYSMDLNGVDKSLYTSYQAETGTGSFRTGLKKDLTVGMGMKSGVYMNWVNNNLVPELQGRAEEYLNIISNQSYAEQMLSKAGLDFHQLHSLGLRKNSQTGVWEQVTLPANATDEEKQQHLVNSRLIHNDLLLMVSALRQHWGGNGELAENIMKAAGFPLHLLTNEPDRNDLNPWNKPGISADDGGDDDGGAGGNYSGTGKLSSAAPKQVIVNITNLLSVETIELLKTSDGQHPEIQDLKEQMAEALISVVHDFDASWNG